MKVHNPNNCPAASSWHVPEAAQINFALFPDIFVNPPPPPPPTCVSCDRMRTQKEPQQDGLFTRFATWVGTLIDRMVGNDV